MKEEDGLWPYCMRNDRTILYKLLCCVVSMIKICICVLCCVCLLVSTYLYECIFCT